MFFQLQEYLNPVGSGRVFLGERERGVCVQQRQLLALENPIIKASLNFCWHLHD